MKDSEKTQKSGGTSELEAEIRTLKQQLAQASEDLHASNATIERLREEMLARSSQIQAVETRHHSHREATLQGIFNSTTDFITIYKVTEQGDLVLESLNKSAELSFGAAFVQMIGTRIEDLLNSPQAAKIIGHYRAAVISRKPEAFEEELVLPSATRNFLTTVVPILDTNLSVERVAALSRDITSFKTIERDLRNAKDSAEIANRAKSDFLASMSHELRTPLNVVLGLSQLLEGTHLDTEQDGYVKSIHRSGRVLLALIEDVLDISKIEAGKVRLDQTAFDLRDMVTEVVDLFSAQANERALDLKLVMLADAERTVVGDPGRMRQILVNFVGNALKFTDRGSVLIRVDVTEGSELPLFKFEVIDTGIGIRAEDHNKIFQKFSQVQSGNSRRYGGTGLGLVISKHLTDLMGGEIGFESEVGSGSRFWFSVALPVVNRQERGVRSASPNEGSRLGLADRLQLAGVYDDRKPLKKTLINAAPPARPLKILAVDDNRESQNVIALLLRRMGHDTQTASSGEEAVDRVIATKFDIVLMDIQMPEMDGYEATARIRNLGNERARVPIVALTANALAGDSEKCLRAGMDAYLTKPVGIDALRNTLEKWMNHRSERTNP